MRPINPAAGRLRLSFFVVSEKEVHGAKEGQMGLQYDQNTAVSPETNR